MIKIQDLTKYYSGTLVVDKITFSVEDGEVFGFLGENGAGKTTLMKMAVGLSKSDGGGVYLDGVSVNAVLAREKIGFMPEAPYFYERLTGLEFMRLCSDLFNEDFVKTTSSFTVTNAPQASVVEDCENILRSVNMYEVRNKAIGTYSKGMKQRLGFAQVLVNDPKYIFLDEPLDGLDPIGRREMKEIIRELKRKGKTVFFNSHILYDIEEVCDRVGIIHRGKLLFCGPVKEFCGGKTLEDRFVEFIGILNPKS